MNEEICVARKTFSETDIFLTSAEAQCRNHFPSLFGVIIQMGHCMLQEKENLNNRTMGKTAIFHKEDDIIFGHPATSASTGNNII